jgi:hypothetical protein
MIVEKTFQKFLTVISVIMMLSLCFFILYDFFTFLLILRLKLGFFFYLLDHLFVRSTINFLLLVPNRSKLLINLFSQSHHQIQLKHFVTL